MRRSNPSAHFYARTNMPSWKNVMLILTLCLLAMTGGAQDTKPAQGATDKGMMMLTIFLKHDQSKTLDEIEQHLQQTGFRKNFPPAGVEVVSWYVMMGIGQVVTLRFPAERLREVNLAIEHGAWGAYRTEFYATYDYLPVWKASRQGSGSH
jgi:hypothetical protein